MDKFEAAPGEVPLPDVPMIEYDAAGRTIKRSDTDTLDLEAQSSSEEDHKPVHTP